MIIGLCGPAGAGKTTVADMMCRQADAVNYSVARPIRHVARAWFGWDGLKDERGRRLLQQLGAVGREYYPDIWADAMAHALVELRGAPLITVDDIRMANEADVVHHARGVIVRVAGRAIDLGANAADATEAGVPSELIDYELDNTGTMDDLAVGVTLMLAQINADKEAYACEI